MNAEQHRMTPDQQRLVAKYMPLAKNIAGQVHRTAPHALDLGELISQAYLGLCMAAERWGPYCLERNYDTAREEFFEPFAKLRIRGAIMDYLRTIDWASRSLRSRARSLQKAGQDRGISVAELAARTEMSEKDVRETMRDMSQRPVSLEAEEIDKAEPQSVEAQASGAALLAVVVQTVRELEPECRVVLSLHYFASIELQEVANRMGITESRASHLHTKSVLTVREALMAAVEGYQ